MTADTSPTAGERRAVLLTGPALRDVDAAIDCPCGCHPRVADASLHSGGSTCPCQLTRNERRTAAAAFMERMAKLSAELAPALRAQRDEFAQAAQRHGVDNAQIRCGGAPLIITGISDGQTFYFRERHGDYTVEVPTGDPTTDLYTHSEEPSEVIASGCGDPTPAEALELAVTAVRTRGCTHPDARRFCPDCGVRVGVQ